MLENSWSNRLAQQPKLATIVDIPDPTILYQTSANQLMAHSQAESSPLPIRKDILALSSLPTGEVLLLSRYQLICFDLVSNNQLFSLQFQNASRLFVERKDIFVGCGCDLFCYSFQGQERFVNHFSALIQALTTVQIKDSLEVVIGLSDLTLTRFKGVNVSYDYGKTAGEAVSMAWIGEGVLVGTQEGTVALHEGKKSKWRAKSTHPVLQVMAHRTQADYLALIIRKDGLIEIKDWKGNGLTLHKLKLSQEVINVFVHDFRKDDNRQLVCVLRSGTVKGVNIYQDLKKIEKNQIPEEVKGQLQSLQDQQAERLNLQFQIAQLKQLISKALSEQSPSQEGAILSKDFNFQTFIHHTDEGFILELTLLNGYISGLSFEEPIMPAHYDRATKVQYLFKAENIVHGEINCLALVHSSYSSKVYQAMPFKIALPKFWKFNQVAEVKHKVTGGIRFNFVERNARYVKWVSQCFFNRWNQEEKTKLEALSPLRLRFTNPYDKADLELAFYTKEGKVEIWCDSLKTLGDIYQDFIQYVGGKELDSELWFSHEKDRLRETLTTIERLSQAKVSISSEMAEAVDNIKFLLVKGESARCVGSMNDLRKTYAEVMGFNRSLLVEIQKKNLNTQQLSQALKVLGQFINQTANVRYGKAKEQVIAGCRQAIKKKEFPKIVTIMERGASAVQSGK